MLKPSKYFGSYSYAFKRVLQIFRGICFFKGSKENGKYKVIGVRGNYALVRVARIQISECENKKKNKSLRTIMQMSNFGLVRT